MSSPWCGACDPHSRIDPEGQPCAACHPSAAVSVEEARRWCGECHRRTRLTADGRRCQRCNPLAGRDDDPYRRRAWCGRCDKRDRMVRDTDGVRKCRACHPLGRPPAQWPMHDVPDGYTEQLMACEWLCYVSPTLRRAGSDRLRVLLQLWFEAGWTPRDVLYALDHLPTGETQPGEIPTAAADPRTTEAYVKRRLRGWLDGDDGPLPPVNRQIADNRRKVVAAQEAAREEWLRRSRVAVPPTLSRGAAQARQVARDAAERNRRRRRAADDRELLRRGEELAAGQEVSARWRELLAREAQPHVEEPPPGVVPPAPPAGNDRLRAALSAPTQMISLSTLGESLRGRRPSPSPRPR
ncbi:hypothetical protein ACTMTJ_43950 [Phytohabitans sp. LJ34]|uniref:hypothetical protein n=1 Tax=Phytohabitans sp. LJ34 TaxID=3452217 RepID=UPI003F8C5DE8